MNFGPLGLRQGLPDWADRPSWADPAGWRKAVAEVCAELGEEMPPDPAQVLYRDGLTGRVLVADPIADMPPEIRARIFRPSPPDRILD